MSEPQDVFLPDIGDFDAVDVVEILVSSGEQVKAEQSLIVLESDKATMEVPAPFAGVVEQVTVAVGDQVGEGARIAVMRADGAAAASPAGPTPGEAAAPPAVEPPASPPPPVPSPPSSPAPSPVASPPPAAVGPAPEFAAGKAHASPAVRRLARELGVELSVVSGTGRKGRVTKDDVHRYVKTSLQTGAVGGAPFAGLALPALPEIDFSKWGTVEVQPLNRIRKLSSANLHRSWVTVPHVTQFDEADITDLNAFRKDQKSAAQARGIKLTFLPFVVKAVTRALADFPHFNASLDPTGENLVLKRYFHIGVAVDTDNGLVVPTIRDADKKGLFEIAADLEELSSRARERKLRPADLQGGTFSISSLGGIGGTFFTPIVNHPEVAILGVSRMEYKPVFQDGAFVPRLILPLSLSYDHRVIDGANAVRFTSHLRGLLSDLRKLLL